MRMRSAGAIFGSSRICLRDLFQAGGILFVQFRLCGKSHLEALFLRLLFLPNCRGFNRPSCWPANRFSAVVPIERIPPPACRCCSAPTSRNFQARAAAFPNLFASADCRCRVDKRAERQ